MAAAFLIAAVGISDCYGSKPATGSRSTLPPPGSAAEKRAREPQSIDLRPVFQKWSLDPRVQGKRGTCSVFVVTESLEYAVASKQNRATRLSVEFLNWAKNKATKTAEDGGFFSDLWKGYAAYGICPEKEMPYLDHFDPALQPNQGARATAKAIRDLALQVHWIKEWNPKQGLSEQQLVEVKRTLQRRWPVCGGFLWPKQEHWEKSVLQMCPRDQVRDGHSVLLVGFRDDPTQPGGGVFLIRNSSGKSRDGLLSYEYLRAYMNDAVWIDCAGRNTGGPSPPGAILDERGATASPDLPFRGPLGALVAPPTGRNRRISSNEQPNWNDGNMDMTWLQPGQVLEMPLLKGPGVITHIWFTSHAGWVNELNALSIRIYWDGRKEPGVEAPLGDFFAVGQGKPAVVESVPVQVSPTGALSCYWRMPFAKSARIVISNDNPDRGAGLYWQVDWLELDSLPPDTGYLHARYRQEYPAVMGRDYVIADLAGCGQYVGTVLSVTLAQDGWFGEGDDFFYIDGEQVPSLQGTGSEDYFNDAWGFRPRSSHWFGQPRWQGDRTGDSGVCYRWHVLDPVGFHKSLRLAIEHKGNYENDLDGFFLERPDFFSSVAFWYQTGEPKAFGSLPPWRERRVPWQHQHMVRAFLKARSTGSAKVEVQTQGFFGARPLLAWPNKEIGARLTVPLAVDEDGRYAVRLTAAQGPQYGRYSILLDEQAGGEGDFRAREEGELDLPLGTRVLSKGAHTLTFQAIGDRTEDGPPVAKPLAIEMLRLLKLPPPATRQVKTHNEAHFVRLGIGRSLYAYRLAYGKLPDSLETLVRSGILPQRYLNDENGLPLKCWRDGEYLVVQSPAANGWKYRWQGLDPRR
jgi:hypothetical protein